MRVVKLSNSDVLKFAIDMKHRVGDRRVIYGVPYNGIPVAYVMRYLLEGDLTDDLEKADLIVYAVLRGPEGKSAALIENPDPCTIYRFPWEPE